MQLVSLILQILQELLGPLPILLLLLIRQQIVRHQLRMHTASTSVQLFFLLLGPDVVGVFCQSFGHVLHFSGKVQIRHVYGMGVITAIPGHRSRTVISASRQIYFGVFYSPTDCQ